MSKQRLFEVGDKVCHPLWEGVATVVENRHKEGNHIITIKDPTSSGIYHSFYSNGLRYGEHEPSLRHAETGSPCVVGEPPERFKYPLYMTNDCYIVEFTGLTVGTVMANDNGVWKIGYSTNEWTRHTDRKVWTPCDKPKWKPTKPTWCWVWDVLSTKTQFVLVIGYDGGMYVTSNDASTPAWDNAEPCDQEDIPDYWPKEWL